MTFPSPYVCHSYQLDLRHTRITYRRTPFGVQAPSPETSVQEVNYTLYILKSVLKIFRMLGQSFLWQLLLKEYFILFIRLFIKPYNETLACY